METIPVEFRDLLVEQSTNATVTTMSPVGLPHMSIVWVDYDADRNRVLINTERGRRKEKNVSRDPRAGLLAPDRDDWYRWLSVAGEVETVTTEGAREHIDALARRYLGQETYPNPIKTERVILELRPDRVVTFDPTG